MSKRPLCVAILWHMHQPDYRNVQTGEICLPWTRFHGVKDYYDMGALVADVPGLHVTINVVPSLMDQVHAYGQGTARETYAALTLRNAAELDLPEKTFLLRSFFQLPWNQMVLPYPRYRELLERRGSPDERGDYTSAADSCTTQDYRDLQVWFNLSWCGRELRQDSEIAALFLKGRDFSEEEKKRLVELQYRFMARILPFYGRLMREHGIELSLSPYCHPILPLLCDNRSAREAMPDIPLPANPFSFPGDAREQIRRAQQRYLEEFGQPARGMWPSEGSISEATATLAGEAGFRWLASDDAVLYNSLKKTHRVNHHLTAQQKFSAYRWGGGPCFFFRDHGLSDLIGFAYARWKPLEAAADFLSRFREIWDALPDDGRYYVVPVILDGENAWEHYPDNGTEFLRALYRGLANDERLRAVTFSEFLEMESHREELGSIVAGSWIFGNLATWIGHPEKNRAWELLTAARSFFSSRQQEAAAPARLQEAFSELMIAEGSDWFWWYGDDHQTENAAQFDSLFRGRVKNVYRLLGQPHPLALDVPIKKAGEGVCYRNPVHTVSPRLDGQVTDYFEWLSAGFAIISGGTGAMHRAENHLERIFFGYDMHHFYLRLDLAGDPSEAISESSVIQVQFVAPRARLLQISRAADRTWNCEWAGDETPEHRPVLGAGRILELGIPLEALDVRSQATLRFSVSILHKNRELQRYPPHDFLDVSVDPREIDRQEWIV